METLLYVVFIALLAVIVWLLLMPRPSTPPQIVYIEREQPVSDNWWSPFLFWESPWWNDTAPYRWSYERLYDGGWPWRRGNEKVYPSRGREQRRQRRNRPQQQQQQQQQPRFQQQPRPLSVQPTINIQLPPAINTVTQRGVAPPPLPVAPPAPEPIPTIHTGPTAAPAAPPAATEPLQVKLPDVIVPGVPDQEPLATVS